MSRFMLAIVAFTIFFAPKVATTQPFEYQVEHLRAFRNSRGTLVITPEAIEYKTTAKNDSRTWRYMDIQQIKIASPTELEIVTYEDERRLLGRDRLFKFKLLQGQITPEVSARLMANAPRQVITSVMPEPEGRPTFELPVKHLHTFGGCQGVLRIYPDRVTYESTTKPSDSRYWRYADIQTFSHSTRYRFDITTFENQFGGPTRAYNFELKEEFPALAYDYIWVRVNPSGFYPTEKTAPPPTAPPLTSHSTVRQ